MSEIFVEILGASLSTGILIGVLLLLSPLVNHRYAAKWRFWIWAVIALRLLIPVSEFPYRSDVENAYPSQTQYSSQEEEGYRQEPQIQGRQGQTYPRIEIAIPQQLVEPINRPDETQPDGTPKKAVSPLSVISCIWAAGAAILFATQILSFMIYKRKIRRHGFRLTEGQAYDTFISLRKEMALHGRLKLIYSPDAPTPMIMGYLKPIMVLPRTDYSQEQMRFIIKHELIHFKRRDIWVKLLMAAAVSLHWFNPFVWLMRRRADVDMELSADDGVVEHAGFDVKKAYTEAIYSTVAKRSPAPSGLSTGFGGGKRILKKRFYNIMTKFNKKNGAVLLIVVAVLVVTVGAVIGFSKIPDSVSDVTLGEEEMNSLIANSLTIDGYLNVEPPTCSFDETADYQGMTYYRVTDERYDDWSEWEDYLGSVYTGEILQSMLQSTTVVNIGGRTYCDGGSRGSDWTGQYNTLGQYDVPGERTEKRVGVRVERSYFSDGGEDAAAFDYVFRYTKETGWRIESVAAAPKEDVGGENEAQTPQPVAENTGFTTPDGYTDHQSSKLAVRFEDSENGPMYTDYGQENYMSVRFALPENWNFDGFSVAFDENGKSFELGNPFPVEDFNPDFFRKFPEGTELPKEYMPNGGEAWNVKVLEEGEHEWSPEEPYLFKSRSIMSYKNGDYESLTYIVRDGEWCMYLRFTKTDPDDAGFDERCENIIRTVTVAQIVTLNQTVSVSPEDYASGDGREFDLNFWLPDGMSVSKSNEAISNLDPIPSAKWHIYIYNADGDVVGAASFDKYEPNPEDTSNKTDIFAPIDISSGGNFDVSGTYRTQISNATFEIATAMVKRDNKANFGILSYNTELNVYVAFEFDRDLIDKATVDAIASLVRIEEKR